MKLMRRAVSSGSTLSSAFFDASVAMSASFNCPPLAASRTRSTPTTTPRPRTPRPTNLRIRPIGNDGSGLGFGGIATFALATVIRSQLVHHRDQAVGFARRDAREPQVIFALEIDDVVERLVAALLE